MATRKRKDTYIKLIAGASVIALLIATAAVASYMTRESIEPEKTTVVYRETAGTQQMAARTECDDGNIVGTVGGAVAGGLIGNNIGSGSGRTAATIGGTLGGAYLGKKYIPTQGATCN